MELNIQKWFRLKMESRVIKNSLSNICEPASVEIGLILRDKIRSHRLTNLSNVTEAFRGYKVENLSVNPKCLIPLIESASLEENTILQNMWAGLLASSCNKVADDDNFVYINLLKQLTVGQVKLINYVCEETPKECIKGLYIGKNTILETSKLFEIMETTNLEKVDRELDNLRYLGIINGGYIYGKNPENANITMSPLGLTLHARCNGHRGSIGNYYNIAPEDTTKKPEDVILEVIK